MNYYVITDRKQIEDAQQQFWNLLKQNADTYQQCTVGYQGGKHKIDLFWHWDLKFWYGYGLARNRHWNIFGNTHPESKANHSILCEINVPYEGRNNLVQGLFVRNRDREEKLYVVHQGKLTITGQEGEGAKFLDWVRKRSGKERIIVDVLWDEGDSTEAIMVAALDDQKFLRRIKDFIVKALNFKNQKKGVHTY